MPQTFLLSERLAGIVAQGAREGDQVQILTRESLTSIDGSVLSWRLEELHKCLFAQIPQLPPASQIDHLIVVIAPDLATTAYFNELQPTARVTVGRSLQAGEPVLASDVRSIVSYDWGVPIPPDAGVVVVQSHGWRRALFYDFGPLIPDSPARNYDVSAQLAEQMFVLLASKFSDVGATVAMRAALGELEELLQTRCVEEAKYQELLHRNPWMLGGQHSSIERHTNLDDRNIPDFTGVRARDGARDLFEIKQPFLPLFVRHGQFSSQLNAAWEQAERYLTFVREQREYLAREKNLQFEAPRCFLLIGANLTDQQNRRLQQREAHNAFVSVLTYDQLLRVGKTFVQLLERASGGTQVRPAG